jgi:hypothetical protein
MGGETLAETNLSYNGERTWLAAGYSDQKWLQTIEEITQMYQAAFPESRLYAMVDSTFFDGSDRYYSQLLQWLVSLTPRWGLQYNGLTSSTPTMAPQWYQAQVVMEQRFSTSESGDDLCSDLYHGRVNMGASYLLIYRSDIDSGAHEGCLQYTSQFVQR